MKIIFPQHSILLLLLYHNTLKIYKASQKSLFYIIAICEQKINKNTINICFNLLSYVFCYNKTECTQGETGSLFYLTFTFKEQPDIIINEAGKLVSNFIYLFFQIKGMSSIDVPHKYLSVKVIVFNGEYLMTLLSRINKEEKDCLLMEVF